MGKIIWRHPWHLFLVILAYVPFLWRFAVPMTGDQKTYIAIAMEMRERGEWLIPYLFGEPNYLKPPFQYWMTLLGWNVFGFNLLGTMLPSVLALVATSYFLNEISSLLGERRWHVSSGLWFATTVGALTFATSAQMEIYICLFFSAAWWCALRFLSEVDAERRPGWLYSAFLVAGMCAWVKSPLYSVLWVLGFFSYLIVNGEWLMFKSRHLYFGLLAGIAAGMLWFGYVAAVDFDRFWNVYWEQEQAGKRGGNGGTLKSLWLPLTYLAFPLTLILLAGARSVFVGRRTVSIARFVACWCWAPALFFSIYPYRTSIYLFILVPALAVFVDWACFRGNRTRTYQWFARATAVLTCLGLLAVAFLAMKIGIVPEWIILALAFAAAAAAMALWTGWIRTFLACMLAVVLFYRISSVEVMRPTMDGLRTLIPPEKDLRVGMLDEGKNIWHEIGLLAVTLGQPMQRLYGLDDLLEILESGGTVILSDEEWDKYSLTLESWLKDRGKSLEAMTWRRFKRGGKIPIRQVFVQGRDAIPNWEETMNRNFHVLRAARM